MTRLQALRVGAGENTSDTYLLEQAVDSLESAESRISTLEDENESLKRLVCGLWSTGQFRGKACLPFAGHAAEVWIRNEHLRPRTRGGKS